VKNVAKVLTTETITIDSTGKGTLAGTPVARLGDDETVGIIGMVAKVDGVVQEQNAVTFTKTGTAYEFELGAEYANKSVLVEYTKEKIGAKQIDIGSLNVGAKLRVIASFDLYYGSDSKNLTTFAGKKTYTLPVCQLSPDVTDGGEASSPLTQTNRAYILAPPQDAFADACEPSANSVGYITYDLCDTNPFDVITGLIGDPVDIELDATTTSAQIAIEGVVDGDTYPLEADKFDFVSTDTAIATVDATGLVHSVAVGTATITATVKSEYSSTLAPVSVPVDVTAIA
jgi:hypothetical protein